MKALKNAIRGGSLVFENLGTSPMEICALLVVWFKHQN